MTTTFPFPFYYTTGSDIVVTCWLPPSTHTFQHWTHPTGEYISTTNGRNLITRDQFTVTLRVTNGQSSDGGSYTCHASESLNLLMKSASVSWLFSVVGGESVTSSVSARFTLPIQVYSTSESLNLLMLFVKQKIVLVMQF